jgi:hypothetical protein
MLARGDEGGRGIDHVVLAVRDLDAAAAGWARVGFTLTPTARHSWGTANRLVQLDGAFLEVLAIDRPELIPERDAAHFSFGAFNRDFLADGEGASMLVLDSRDADQDIAAFGRAGLPTFERFDFERTARQPDGEERRVAFSLAFTEIPSEPRVGFFTCRHHFPENFWKAEYKSHANGARRLTAVTLVAEDPADHHQFLTAFAGTKNLRMTSLGLEIVTPRGLIEVLTPAGFRHFWGAAALPEEPRGLSIRGLRFGVRVLGDAAGALIAGGCTVRDQAGRFVIASEPLHGVAVAFEPLGDDAG